MFLYACTGSIEKKLNAKKKMNLEHNILNLASIYSQTEKMISFPVLFNDSVVKAMNITSIERLEFYHVSDSVITENESNLPNKKTNYYFDEQGQVKKMIIGNYYDNRMISSIEMVFSNKQEETGFSSLKTNETWNSDEFPYAQYFQLPRSKHLYRFENLQTKNKLYIVPNKKHWKPLVIDTLCKPNPNDLIVWGSLKQPIKIYQVKDLVKESNVRRFTYDKKNQVLKRMDWNDEPFQIHRTFQFNQQGLCKGFVDSTFSLGRFVNAAVYEFELKDKLPRKITKKIKIGDQQRLIFEETFTYTFSVK